MTADDATGAVAIYEQGGRGLYADDLGLTVHRRASRPERINWSEISRFADEGGTAKDGTY